VFDQAGIISSGRYGEEYKAFPEKGLDLHPLILTLVSWGDRHYG